MVNLFPNVYVIHRTINDKAFNPERTVLFWSTGRLIGGGG